MPNFLVSTWEDSGQTTATDLAGSAVAPRVDVFVPFTCEFPGESFGRFW